MQVQGKHFIHRYGANCHNRDSRAYKPSNPVNESTDAGGIGAILKFGDLVGDEHRLSHETDNKIGTSEAANENVGRRMEKRRLPDH